VLFTYNNGLRSSLVPQRNSRESSLGIWADLGFRNKGNGLRNLGLSPGENVWGRSLWWGLGVQRQKLEFGAQRTEAEEF